MVIDNEVERELGGILVFLENASLPFDDKPLLSDAQVEKIRRDMRWMVQSREMVIMSADLELQFGMSVINYRYVTLIEFMENDHDN